jgi:hypothetical protein
MTAEEIQHRIALLFNPMPDMSGNNINRFHGERRRQIEDLAQEIVDTIAQSQNVPEILSNPDAVHVNMIRGTIAKPSLRQIVHLYGPDELRQALKDWA